MTVELQSKIGSTPIVNKPLVNTSTYISCACMQDLASFMVMYYKKFNCYVAVTSLHITFVRYKL